MRGGAQDAGPSHDAHTQNGATARPLSRCAWLSRRAAPLNCPQAVRGRSSRVDVAILVARVERNILTPLHSHTTSSRLAQQRTARIRTILSSEWPNCTSLQDYADIDADHIPCPPSLHQRGTRPSGARHRLGFASRRAEQLSSHPAWLVASPSAFPSAPPCRTHSYHNYHRHAPSMHHPSLDGASMDVDEQDAHAQSNTQHDTYLYILYGGDDTAAQSARHQHHHQR